MMLTDQMAPVLNCYSETSFYKWLKQKSKIKSVTPELLLTLNFYVVGFGGIICKDMLLVGNFGVLT